MKINKHLLSIIIAISFLFTQEGLMFLYSYLFGTEFILESKINLLLIQLSIYVIILIIAIFVWIRVKPTEAFYSKNNYLYIIVVLFISFLTIIIVNPVNRFNQIIGLVEFSTPTFNSETSITFQLFKFISLVIIVPINEELIFRGVILKTLILNKKRLFLGILFSSFLFASIHIDPFNLNYNYLLNVFISGIIFGIIYIRFGLMYSIISHSFVNLIWFVDYFYNFKLNFINYLDFGILYWLIVCVAFIIINIFAIHSYKSIINQ